MVRDGLLPRVARKPGRAGRCGGIGRRGNAAADQAMAVLRKAVGKGYRNATLLRTDPVVDPLREREDFKKLIEELEKESPAKPENPL